jgi:hypothetical protein
MTVCAGVRGGEELNATEVLARERGTGVSGVSGTGVDVLVQGRNQLQIYGGALLSLIGGKFFSYHVALAPGKLNIALPLCSVKSYLLPSAPSKWMYSTVKSSTLESSRRPPPYTMPILALHQTPRRVHTLCS